MKAGEKLMQTIQDWLEANKTARNTTFRDKFIKGIKNGDITINFTSLEDAQSFVTSLKEKKVNIQELLHQHFDVLFASTPTSALFLLEALAPERELHATLRLAFPAGSTKHLSEEPQLQRLLSELPLPLADALLLKSNKIDTVEYVKSLDDLSKTIGCLKGPRQHEIQKLILRSLMLAEAQLNEEMKAPEAQIKAIVDARIARHIKKAERDAKRDNEDRKIGNSNHLDEEIRKDLGKEIRKELQHLNAPTMYAEAFRESLKDGHDPILTLERVQEVFGGQNGRLYQLGLKANVSERIFKELEKRGLTKNGIGLAAVNHMSEYTGDDFQNEWKLTLAQATEAYIGISLQETRSAAEKYKRQVLGLSENEEVARLTLSRDQRKRFEQVASSERLKRALTAELRKKAHGEDGKISPEALLAVELPQSDKTLGMMCLLTSEDQVLVYKLCKGLMDEIESQNSRNNGISSKIAYGVNYTTSCIAAVCYAVLDTLMLMLEYVARGAFKTYDYVRGTVQRSYVPGEYQPILRSRDMEEVANDLIAAMPDVEDCTVPNFEMTQSEQLSRAIIGYKHDPSEESMQTLKNALDVISGLSPSAQKEVDNVKWYIECCEGKASRMGRAISCAALPFKGGLNCRLDQLNRALTRDGMPQIDRCAKAFTLMLEIQRSKPAQEPEFRDVEIA